MALRRMVLDSLTHLVQLGYTRAPIQHVLEGMDRVDESLTIHFIRKTLSAIHPPYERGMYGSLRALIRGVSLSNLEKDDAKELVQAFNDDAPEA
jgi:hypothetical protein